MVPADGLSKERPGRPQVRSAAFLEREGHVGSNRRFHQRQLAQSHPDPMGERVAKWRRRSSSRHTADASEGVLRSVDEMNLDLNIEKPDRIGCGPSESKKAARFAI